MSPDPSINVPLLDLKAQFADIQADVMAAVSRVLRNQSFILGPEVTEAEKELAAYTGAAHALGVSSGSDALLLSLMGLGIGPGDGVVTTPFTFFATVGSIVRLGARPLFVDIDPVTYNLDPAKAAELLDRSDLPAPPKAMMPVHLFGQAADMQPLRALAKQYNLKIVEDAAQALGAQYSGLDGQVQKVGNLGDTGCFSFFPSKNLGGAGDGGLITCNQPELAERLRSMRTHGSHPKEKYRHIYVGGNFRLDAIQAAVIKVKLPHLDDWARARNSNARDYDRLFTQSGLVERELISLPTRVYPDLEFGHVYNQYVIRAKDRDGLLAALKKADIGCAVYYPSPMHLLECFADLGGKPGDLPESEKAAGEVLALPVYPELTTAQKERVVQVVAGFYR
jgi:dTDP-4-amino-4,6-dideoxygalactose transaminase